MLNLKDKSSANRLYYGWYILAASFIILFFNSGAQTTFGILFKPMIADFGWSRGTLSFAFLLNMIIYSITLIVAGKLYDRYGPKRILITATVFVSAGYILCAFIASIWQFYICFGFFAAIGLGGTSIPLFAAVMSKWFSKWRGLIISLALSGTCLGRFALIPFFSYFQQNYGWRASYLLIGIIMFIINMILILSVIKNKPDSSSAKTPGKVNAREIDKTIAAENLTGDLRLKDAMKTRSFWLFTLMMFICGSGDFLISNHLIPFATDNGISSGTAGSMLAWSGLISLAGILIAGPLSDIIGNKIPIALTFLLRILSFRPDPVRSELSVFIYLCACFRLHISGYCPSFHYACRKNVRVRSYRHYFRFRQYGSFSGWRIMDICRRVDIRPDRQLQHGIFAFRCPGFYSIRVHSSYY